MPAKRENILIVEGEAGANLPQRLQDLLSEAGYQVSVAASRDEGLRLVRGGGIDVFLVLADLTDLQSSHALADIKSLSAARKPRVIVVSRGGAAERARALDLGADDVLSAPWEPSELLARLRAQLRAQREIHALEEKTRIADEGREVAQTAFQALAVTEKMTRDAFSLDRALKIGVSVLFALALVVGGIFLLYSRRADKEARRAYSVIAQLERGVQTREQLLTQAQKARQELNQTDLTQHKEQLQQQAEDLRQKLSTAQSADASGLRQQLDETTSRLHKIEAESAAAEGVIHSYMPSVCLLHVSVGFVDQASRRTLRYETLGTSGEPLKGSEGNPIYTLEGRAPEVRADFFGTGFIVGEGKILTNHHVVQPWWNNDELSSVTQQGLQPVIAVMTAYFPESERGISVEILQISDEADLALLHADLSGLKRPLLKLDARKEAAVSGQPLLSVGYATGLSAILARASDDAVNDIVKVSAGDPRIIIEELARRRLIRPLVTQGHIGDVLADKIVYDAQTTSGSSGGPLINRDGQVIGVTFAVVKDFGGSNFGVPIRYAEPLLKH